MKAPHKRGVDAVQDILRNISEQEENMGDNFLAHMFWGVLENSCRHFSNPLSPEAAQVRYIYTEKFRLPSTRLGHIAKNLAYNKPSMNVLVQRQCIGRGATSEVRYQSVGPIIKYQG